MIYLNTFPSHFFCTYATVRKGRPTMAFGQFRIILDRFQVQPQPTDFHLRYVMICWNKQDGGNLWKLKERKKRGKNKKTFKNVIKNVDATIM